MPSTSHSTAGIAYDRAGPRDKLPVVLIHAGIADRRMWDPLWAELTIERDVVRLDLRGFGESTARPSDALCPAQDVLDTLADLRVRRCHLVGASFGAGVAVEVALTRPAIAASLMLVAPGGSLIPEATPELREFATAEGIAMARGDVDAAVEANLSWWVDGPRRTADAVDQGVRDQVRRMQRLAFDLTADWDDVEEEEIDPPALDRLDEVQVPTLVLVGAQDLDAIHQAAQMVTTGIPGARRIDWEGVAHLPSMERPGLFLVLLREWLAS